jgi:virginiamycin B lyase
MGITHTSGLLKRRNVVNRFNTIIVGASVFIILLGLPGCSSPPVQVERPALNPLDIKEWQVPWEQTRPRDPYLDQQHRVWFVGQTGNYLAVLDLEVEQFQKFPLDSGTGPHNVIVDEDGLAWYAGNRGAHIGTLNPTTGTITKHPMPDPGATDPHTLIFGKDRNIWFTVQQGNFVGHLDMPTGEIHLIPLPTPHARPYGIAMGPGRAPWFAEFGTNKLGTINPDTHRIREIPLSRSEARPRRLAVTSKGVIWYVDHAEGYLGSYNPDTGHIQEWLVPGGTDARPYAMTVDDQDRIWFVETGSSSNRLVGFDTRKHTFLSLTDIPSGGGTVRHMIYHRPTRTIWFGTDANTIGRAKLP